VFLKESWIVGVRTTSWLNESKGSKIKHHKYWFMSMENIDWCLWTNHWPLNHFYWFHM